MKKEVFFLLLLVFFIQLAIAQGINNTNKTITGKATSIIAALNITVTDAAPTLVIHKPRNQTYFYNKNLEIEADTNGNFAWSNIDNGNNITLSGSGSIKRGYFNTTFGWHKLFVFANNSLGTLTKKSLNFTIEMEKYNISYSNYSGAHKGSTTDFNLYSFEELQNLTDIKFEHTSYGKILFNGTINITNDENPYDNITDFDKHIKILENRIFLNSTALKNFNFSATLTLYGLSFTNPRIALDSQVCPSTICKINSYSSGTLSFNVSHFTEFEAEETPASSSSSTSSSGGGGGGGGGGSGTTILFSQSPKENIQIIPELLNINLISNQETTEDIIIVNNENKALSIDTEVQSVDIDIPSTITLEPGETKTIQLKIKPVEKGLFIGKIIFKVSGRIIKEIPVIINVRSKDLIFDLSLLIPKEAKSLKKNEPLKPQIIIIPLTQKKTDVSLNYFIKDFSGKVYFEEQEKLYIKEETYLLRKFPTTNLPSGKYIIGLELSYTGGFATASSEFEMISHWRTNKSNVLIYSIIGVIVAAIIFITLIIFGMMFSYIPNKKTDANKTSPLRKRFIVLFIMMFIIIIAIGSIIIAIGSFIIAIAPFQITAKTVENLETIDYKGFLFILAFIVIFLIISILIYILKKKK